MGDKKSLISALNVAPDNITFSDAFRPSLRDGKYTLNVEQSVSSSNGIQIKEEIFNNSKIFCIRGERFNIDPLEFSTIFPPDNATGDYSNVLPHLIFSRKTLPWERTLGPNANGLTWLALLLFDETECLPELKIGTVKNLKPINGGGELPDNVYYPNLELEPGESIDDSCAYIDVDPLLLNKIIPSSNDLQYLVHGRTSKYQDEETGEEKTHEFSVIVCNRFPKSGVKNTVHLVSLENFEQYIEAFDSLPKDHKIRLVSLKNWSFTCINLDKTFSGILQNLNTDPAVFQIKVNEKGQGSESVNNALNMGYIPMNHNTRQGDKTVSWYRGPLTPYLANREINFPITNSDSIIYYDKNTGMFDVSYACAFQLGRLLALQNESFSTAMFKWRHENKQKILSYIEQKSLCKRLGVDGDLDKNIKAIEAEQITANLKSFFNGEN